MGARENDLNPDTWIGLSFPLGRTHKGLFRQTKTTLEQAKHNIRNLLMTIKGERPFQPDFGADIYSYIFEQITEEDLAIQLEESIREAVGVWLPYVDIKSVDVDISNRDKNRIVVGLVFSISLNPNNTEQIALTYETGEY